MLRGPGALCAQSYFRTKVRQWDDQQGGGRPYGSLRLTVRREHVFEDSFHQLRSRTPEEMRAKLNVTFQVSSAARPAHFGSVGRAWRGCSSGAQQQAGDRGARP